VGVNRQNTGKTAKRQDAGNSNRSIRSLGLTLVLNFHEALQDGRGDMSSKGVTMKPLCRNSQEKFYATVWHLYRSSRRVRAGLIIPRNPMKKLNQLFLTSTAAASFALSAQGQVLLNDTWADGTRNNQNLPAESAWFSSDSSGASLTAAVGSMTGAIPSGSVQWLTYYTAAGSPATLGLGQTLTLTTVFTPTGVGAENTGRNLRIGLYDFSGGTRVAADGYSTGSGTGAPGAGVTGYMLNMNFGTTFGVDAPLQIMERTAVSSINLMGASGDYTSLSSGPTGRTGTPGFADGTEYTLEFSVTRTAADSVDITTRFFGGSLDISHTATDTSGANLAFDTFAIRPAGSAVVATSFAFSQFGVEVIPEPSTYALAGLSLLAFLSARRWQWQRRLVATVPGHKPNAE
jgi:hypothetical protein